MKSLCFASLFFAVMCPVVLAQSNPVPLVNQPLIPASVKPGRGRFTLTVTGTGFAPTAVVQWNGTPRSTMFASSSKLRAKISAVDVAKANTASVSVVNPAPGGGSSNAVYFPIRQGAKVFRGTRDRSFTPESKTVAVGDFNNDGKLDVAVAKGDRRIDIFLGNGDGTFGTPIGTPTPSGIVALLAADFNGDGNLDLFAYSAAQSKVTIFWGNGDGSLTEGPSSGAPDANSFALADFNGDGKLDYVAGEPDQLSGPALQVFLGNGDGTFQNWWSASVCCVSFTGLAAVGDFNGDGKLDFANSGLVFLGRGDGTFTTDNVFYVDVNDSIATADVSGDGKLDLVSDRGAVALGNGDGTFTQISDLFLTGANVLLGDINGDGLLDVVLRTLTVDGKQDIDTLLGKGDGTFQNPIEHPAGTSDGERQFDHLRLGDFNGDGRLDVMVPAKATFLFLQK
jgi:hypothetical protein